MVKVVVKWAKQTFKDVEIDTAESLETFQAQLFCLTGVPVDRQKILSKGKKLAADADLLKLKENQKLMLMGSAEVLPDGPSKPVIFEEDLTDDQKVTLSGALGGGLHNLGNTCYMNATLQCFRAVPELKDALNKYANKGGSGDMAHSLTAAMGRLFQEQETKADPVTPAVFTQCFRSLFPRFAETSPQGAYMQQDSDECLQELLNTLNQKMTDVPPGATGRSTIDHLFAGEMTETTTCSEGDEEAKVEKSTFRKLRCHIDSSTNHMAYGINQSMEEQVEKRSVTLGRNAVYNKKSTISKLPKYMTVQFVRFFWRKDTQKKAKILRKVQYPTKFDALEFCDAALKKKLSTSRRVLVADQDKKLGLTRLATAKEIIKAKKEGESGKKEEAKAGDMDTTEDAPSDAPEDVPDTDTSGSYELIGVVTHKGRSADSGHYVGWAKKIKTEEEVKQEEQDIADGKKKKTKPEDEEWVKYDDETVSVVTAQEIQNLSGGGDWHMSYMLFYQRIDDMLERRTARASAAATSS